MSNAEIVKASIELINNTNLDPTTIRKEGAGKAYQSVAQSMAMVIQDVVDYERNLMALSQAAIGVSMEKIVQNPDTNLETYSKVIDESQDIVNEGVKTLAQVGLEAGQILKDFPSGD
ncbi:hypothetical protein [Moorena sp. SIO4G3]|uniref:hypothetical protein n=1 Tax=Moorena sp. SIO4G3 TaxID=2607821 RepID=UPI00142BA41A|nr:hypothetical protein [Moorena sp. SIO4G3]NEO78755.1 hypothetical protein [Moorena sp. SIO4G3]